MTYIITLAVQGNTVSFECEDPTPTRKAWNENKKICVKLDDGKEYFYDLDKYHTMIIEKKNGKNN